MKYCLVIKGDRFQAARVAADRGIGLVFDREVKVTPLCICTVGFTNSDAAWRLIAWFNETAERGPGALLSMEKIDD